MGAQAWGFPVPVATLLQGAALQLGPKMLLTSQNVFSVAMEPGDTPRAGALGSYSRQSVSPRDRKCSQTQHFHESSSPARPPGTCQRTPSRTQTQEWLMVLLEMTPRWSPSRQPGTYTRHLPEQSHPCPTTIPLCGLRGWPSFQKAAWVWAPGKPASPLALSLRPTVSECTEVGTGGASSHASRQVPSDPPGPLPWVGGWVLPDS